MNGKKIAALTALTVTALFVMAAVIAEPADSAPAPVEDSWYSAGDGLFVVKYSSPLDGYYTCTVESASGTVHAASYADLTGQTTIALTVDDGKSVGAGEYTVSIVGAAGSYSETVTVYGVDLGDHVSAKLNGEGDDITASVLLGKKDFVTVAFDTGYELDEAAGMTVTDSKYSADPTADAHSITAKATEYDVAFNIGDSQWKEGSDVPEKYTYGVSLALPAAADLSIYSKTGYAVAFVGWYAEGDTEETIVTEIIAGTTGAMSFVAKYAETPNTYTVVFDSNTGAGEMSDQVFTYDVQQAIAANTFNKTGHTFAGWNTAADGSGTPYADGATVSNLAAEGTVTLYAQWSVNSYKLTVNYTGYSEAIPSHEEDVVYDTAYSVVSPVKTGYTADILTISGTMPAEAVTVTVTYTINTYVITWKNDDDTIIDTTEVNYGAVPAHADATKEATAQYTYAFSGWDPAPAAATQAAIYTAVFEATVNKYTVTLAVDGQGSVSQATVPNVPYGSVFSIDGNVLTINEVAVTATPAQATAQYTYAFDSWSVQSGTAIAGDITVTAKFSAAVNKYTVTLAVDGQGSVSQATVPNVPYGSVFSIDGNVLTIKEVAVTATPAQATAQYTYAFDSWSVQSGIAIAGDITVTAKFSATVNRYAVSFTAADHTAFTDKTGIGVDGKVAYGESFTFKVSADAGYTEHLVVKKDGNTISPEASGVYTVAGISAAVSITTETAVSTFQVLWKNYDGTVLETDSAVPYGTVPVYDGAVPVRTADAQYTYAFSGWNPTPAAIYADAVYDAQFSTTLNKYTIIWTNYDDTVLETDEGVDYGTMPIYNGAVPTKPGDGHYDYTFDKWTPDVAAVTGGCTYKAQFSSDLTRFTITLAAGEHTQFTDIQGITDGKVVYGGSFTFKVSADAGYSDNLKVFNGSAKLVPVDGVYTVSDVMSALTITSSTSISKYAVIWKNYDGTVLATAEADYGATPVYGGQTPVREATAQYTYTFSGWDPVPAALSADAEYVAQFSAIVNKYTVTVVTDGSGTVSSGTVAQVPYGSVFSVDGNVLTINEENVTATPAQATAQYTYAFDSWSVQTGIAIAGDITVTAKFSATVNKYTVTVVTDGQGLVSQASVTNVPYGSVFSINGNVLTINEENVTATPAQATAQYTYAFDSWSVQSGIAIAGDITVTAKFSAAVNKYTVTLAVDGQGSVSQATVPNVPYGSVFTVSDNILTINEVSVTATSADATAQYTYAFDSWSVQSGAAIAGDITVTAKFSASLNTYPVVWKNYDGSVLKTDASVAFGTVPVYSGTEPVREGDAQYSYTFSGWDPEVVAVAGDAEYTATFDRSTNSYEIAVPIVSNGTITVTGGDVVDGKVTVPYGTELTFTFSSDEGYYVTKWNGQDSFRINTFSVTVNGPLDLSCEVSNLYKVSATVIGNGGVSGTGDYAYGTTAELTAEPAEGSEFVSWSDGSTDASISVNVDSDIALTATFRAVAKTYEVTFRASDSTLATVSLESAIVTDGTSFSVENGILVIGDVRVSVTLFAPAPAYVNVFDGWDQESGTVTSAMTFTAKVRATTYYDKTDIFAEDGTKVSGAVFRFDAVFSTTKAEFNMDIWAGVNWDRHPSKNYSYLQYELKITSETGNPYVLKDGDMMTVSLFIGTEYEGLHVYSYHYSNTVGLESFDEQVVTDGAITMEVSDLSPFLVTIPRADPEEHLDMSIVFIGVAAVIGVAVVGLLVRRL